MEVLLSEDAEGLLTRMWIGTESITLGLYNFPWPCSKRHVAAIFLVQSVLLGHFVWCYMHRFVCVCLSCVSLWNNGSSWPKLSRTVSNRKLQDL